jgi:acyl-coenzyme A synthetase/AMP-(fatty) acid ligase
MNAAIHNTMDLISTILACICILAVIALVNFAFSRDKVITRTMRGASNKH